MNSILQRNYRIDFLDLFFNDRFHLPQLLSLIDFFGFINTYCNNVVLENHIYFQFICTIPESKKKLY